MCYLWSEILGRRDYLGSENSSMSLSDPFFFSIKVFQS